MFHIIKSRKKVLMFLKSFIVFWREIKSDFKMNDSFDRITELCGYVL